MNIMLCLPAPDVKALGTGRSICTITSLFIRTGQKFFLCPIEIDDENNYVESCYQPGFRQEAQAALDILVDDLPEIDYWASCEDCTVIDSPEKLAALSALSIWNKDWLISKLSNSKNIFLTTLRTYQLTGSFTLPGEIIYQEKAGKLLSLGQDFITSNSTAILADRTFNRRRKQLVNFSPPLHPVMEILQNQVAQITPYNSEADKLNHDLKVFLDWQEPRVNIQSNHEWIDRICSTGSSSDGNEFEKLVRRSFLELGFTNSLNNTKASVDPNTTGGAGGIDIYCDAPFSLVGECKASKYDNVSNCVSAQLIHLGITHLGKETFDRSVKIIFAAGKLTSATERAAIQNHINIMTPETLQRLVTLKSKHPGAINLYDLEECLRNESFGQAADQKVNNFIDAIEQEIKVRSHIISVLKKYVDSQSIKNIRVEQLHVALNLSQPPCPRQCSEEELYEILLELSSPLTGYLGRAKGDDWKVDQFYFLRSFT
jgi:Domain of unknown function (DUF1802)/Restriction endonuclease